jgi:hypothetical protein
MFPIDGKATMAIKKQEFYEGAAIHLLARSGDVTRIQYDSPFFRFNGELLVLLKYCTRSRSPWGFTFTPDEQAVLQKNAARSRTIIALVCGSDGVAAFSYVDFRRVATPRNSAIHIACYRQHRQHYEVNGPDGTLNEKVAPSYWPRILRT